ncbi:hypothetical protein K0M31_007578 [Melipona bicolor]|uniref:Uncharacterized protein n=1 Tax=Melipona bicolor TaxID=60889 RepID=A0AA40KVS4_9HYME|nr:hypothetical protein K0M31_007578 [Melipona bicolor]
MWDALLLGCVLDWYIVRRIVRNKAAEKAKHAHQQQQAQQQQGQQQGQPGSGGSVSVIAHAPATAAGHPAATTPNAYSISGILGIPTHHQDPNGNSIKRKRTDDGESLNASTSMILRPLITLAMSACKEFQANPRPIALHCSRATSFFKNCYLARRCRDSGK